MNNRIRALLLSACLVAGTLSTQASLSFSFTYSETGTGFNDAQYGQARRNALQSAAATLGSFFNNTGTVTVEVDSWSDSSGALARGGPYVGGSSGFNQTVPQMQVLGSPQEPPHGTLSFNFGQSWDYDDTVEGSLFDFKAVAMHELTHALGFVSLITPEAERGYNAFGYDTWTTFDSFLTDSAGEYLINHSSFDFEATKAAALTGAPGMFFNGPNAVAANGNQLVPIFSPASWMGGSSGSHVDGIAGSMLMNYATGRGPGIRSYTAIERGIMADLGYDMVPVPEPAQAGALAALVLLGCAVIHRCRAARIQRCRN